MISYPYSCMNPTLILSLLVSLVWTLVFLNSKRIFTCQILIWILLICLLLLTIDFLKWKMTLTILENSKQMCKDTFFDSEHSHAFEDFFLAICLSFLFGKIFFDRSSAVQFFKDCYLIFFTCFNEFSYDFGVFEKTKHLPTYFRFSWKLKELFLKKFCTSLTYNYSGIWLNSCIPKVSIWFLLSYYPLSCSEFKDLNLEVRHKHNYDAATTI